MKKLRIFVSSIIIGSTLLSSTVFASTVANTNATPNNQKVTIANKSSIPTYMKPGTLIKYDKDCKMIILIDGIQNYKSTATQDQISNVFTYNNKFTNSVENKKVAQKTKKDNTTMLASLKANLPSPKAGMTVSYDSDGLPSMIKLDGKSIYTSNQEIESVQAASNNYFQSGQGRITSFTDIKGDHDNDLKYDDCAVDYRIDPRCSDGTAIYVNENNSGLTATLYKNDNGNFARLGRVLDIRPEIYNYFVNHGNGNDPYGSYTHY